MAASGLECTIVNIQLYIYKNIYSNNTWNYSLCDLIEIYKNTHMIG